MGYSGLMKAGAFKTDIQEYLAKGKTEAVTIRIPENLCDSAKETASRHATTFSALVREAMNEKFSRTE